MELKEALGEIFKTAREKFNIKNTPQLHLKQDEEILRKWTSGTHPDDFKMFLDLRSKGKVLLCPLNTYSTHGESNWLAPLYKIKQKDLINEWEKHI